MMMMLKELSLLFVIATLFSSTCASQDAGKVRNIRSSLILDYNWPKVSKGLKRLPHVKSCRHFYVTGPNDTHVIKKCPEGESFDFSTLKCVKSKLAKCWSAQFNTDRSKTNQFVCPFPWGPYPDTEDCSRFYSCLNGKAHLRKCAASTLFDKAARKCLDKSEALCADETDIVDPGYKCPYTWGFFTHLKDCSKYYECLQKSPSLRSCKKNMLFENRIRRCLPKNQVKCGARFNPYDNYEKSTSVQLAITTALLSSISSSKSPEEDLRTVDSFDETTKDSMYSVTKKLASTSQTRSNSDDTTLIRTALKSVSEININTKSQDLDSTTGYSKDKIADSTISYSSNRISVSTPGNSSDQSAESTTSYSPDQTSESTTGYSSEQTAESTTAYLSDQTADPSDKSATPTAVSSIQTADLGTSELETTISTRGCNTSSNVPSTQFQTEGLIDVNTGVKSDTVDATDDLVSQQNIKKSPRNVGIATGGTENGCNTKSFATPVRQVHISSNDPLLVKDKTTTSDVSKASLTSRKDQIQNLVTRLMLTSVKEEN